MYTETTSTTTPKTARPWPDYEAMVTELLADSRWVRQAYANDYPQLGDPRMRSSTHVDFYTVGVKGARQSGKTLWAIRRLDTETLVLCSNQTFQRAFREELERMAGDHWDEDLCPRVLTYRDCISHIDFHVRTGGIVPFGALRTVKTVIVDEADHMLGQARGDQTKMMRVISRWSRLGGQVPELITLG